MTPSLGSTDQPSYEGQYKIRNYGIRKRIKSGMIENTEWGFKWKNMVQNNALFAQFLQNYYFAL